MAESKEQVKQIKMFKISDAFEVDAELCIYTSSDPYFGVSISEKQFKALEIFLGINIDEEGNFYAYDDEQVEENAMAVKRYMRRKINKLNKERKQ